MQDAALELLQLWGQLEPELVSEPPASRRQLRERVRASASTMERQRELPHEPLTEGLYRDEPLELRYKLARPAEREGGVDPLLDDDEPLLLEPSDSLGGEGLRRHAGERFAAPLAERCDQQVVPGARVAVAQSRRSLLRPTLEPLEVQLVSLDREHISLPLAPEPFRPDDLPQPKDESVERVGCAWRRRLSPETVDQPVPGDHPIRIQEQQGEQGTLFRPAERLLSPAAHDSDGAEKTELHRASKSPLRPDCEGAATPGCQVRRLESEEVANAQARGHDGRSGAGGVRRRRGGGSADHSVEPRRKARPSAPNPLARLSIRAGVAGRGRRLSRGRQGGLDRASSAVHLRAGRELARDVVACPG